MKLAKVYVQSLARNSQLLRAVAGERLFVAVAAAPRQELSQTILRLAIACAVLVYVAWYVFRDGILDSHEAQALVAATGFVLFAAFLAIEVVKVPRVSVRRRLLGIVVDNGVASYGLYVLGEGGAFILGLYLFVTVGNYFRYGRFYMYISQALAVAGFVTVVAISSFWSQHFYIALGYLIALLIVPIYVGLLANRVTKERKRADEANEARGRFLANVSHEMRTPLNGVIAMADVLRETNLNESQREIVDTLGTSAQLLLVQIEDVLDMSKIEAGRVQIEVKPFELGRLLTNTVKVVMPQARYKSLAVNTEVLGEAARWYVGDSHHLRQVLLNLLSNAVKFTERGTISLRVATVSRTTTESRVRFEVQDTGIGIAQGNQARIFEPFSQADESIGRVYGGTGLGTTIARHLVSLMGGTMGLTSEIGVGSTFWFELPLTFSEAVGIDLTQEVADNARLTSAAAALAGQHGKVTKIKGARILVAEDNPTNQRVSRMILESGGHRPTIVDNGEEALDALERGGFELAIFDLSMPIVSGLEALKLYRYTTSKPIPILILSANVTSEIIDECQRAGCAEFIPKPVRPSMLLGAIERHLSENADAVQIMPPPSRIEERPQLTVIDTPVIDAQVIADLGRLSSDPTFVERLIRGFHADTERLVAVLSGALAGRRYEEAKDAAHALKGGAGSVGATQLVQLAVRFERAEHDLLRAKAAAWTEELTRAANTALAALDRHLEERRQQQSGL
ncbi:MAG: ATP-binding protein [Casimicrobiaceae bacterium]